MYFLKLPIMEKNVPKKVLTKLTHEATYNKYDIKGSIIYIFDTRSLSKQKKIE